MVPYYANHARDESKTYNRRAHVGACAHCATLVQGGEDRSRHYSKCDLVIILSAISSVRGVRVEKTHKMPEVTGRFPQESH